MSFTSILRMGDNTLVLGQRLSEWCGHGPAPEEDIALANIALDLIGQTRLWLDLAGNREGLGRDSDMLAYHRNPWDFKNLLLVEQPNRDFGVTMMRQFLFDTWHLETLRILSHHTDKDVRGIAQKSSKEVTYHHARSTNIVIALGDGTEKSQLRMQSALNRLYPYVGEMFMTDKDDLIDMAALRPKFDAHLSATLTKATLTKPESEFYHKGGKTGTQHSEHLSHILATMQSLPRSYPEAKW